MFVSVSQRQSCSKDSKRKVTVYEKLATGSALSGGGGSIDNKKGEHKLERKVRALGRAGG